MAPGVPLGNELSPLIIVALVSRIPLPVGGKGTSLEHLSQSPLGSSNKMSLLQPILLWSAWGFWDICTLDLGFVFFLIGQGSEEVKWVGEAANMNMNKISRRLFEMVDYITQKCLWVNKKLSLKHFHMSAPEWGASDKAIKPSGTACGISFTAFQLVSYLSYRERCQQVGFSGVQGGIGKDRNPLSTEQANLKNPSRIP